MKRALVLGGGGAVGIGWETAILSGLMDGGIDVRDADLVIGTSAGSVVGTHIAHGNDPRTVAADQAARPRNARAPTPADPTQMIELFRRWSSFDEMTQANRAEIGRLALEAPTASEEEWLAGFAVNRWHGWPATDLLITAVGCQSGEFRAFSKDDGVPIEIAVAASCCVPGMFAPVTIDGVRYMDGGVRSGTSADLASRISPDIVLVVAPMGASGRGIHIITGRQLDAEVVGLEAQGISTRVVKLDEAALEHAANLMDPAAVAPAAAAGLAHGRRLADELRSWWS